MRYFPAPLSRLESAALIGRIRGHFAEHGYGPWALERKDTGAFIGLTGLAQVGFDAAFTRPWRSPGVWRAAIGAGFCPVRRRGPLCVAGLTSSAWTRWCPSPLKVIPLARKVSAGHRHALRPQGDFDHPALAPDHPLRRHVLYRISREQWLAKLCMDNLSRPFTMTYVGPGH